MPGRVSFRPEALARALLEAAPDPIVVADFSGTIVLVNREAERAFGYERAGLVGKGIDLLVPDEQRAGHAVHRAVYRAAPTTRSMGESGAAVNVRRADGSTYAAEISLSPLETDKGRYVIAIVRDVTARRELEARLRHLVTHDALTGLYSRAYFEAECGRLDRGRSHPVGVLSVDADGLKRINDTKGHDAGDDLLQRVATVLAATFRGDDVVARVGGDEFVVLLPRHDDVAVARAVRRLRRAATTAGVSVSVGGATAGGAETPVRQALRRADLAMLADKRRRKRERTA